MRKRERSELSAALFFAPIFWKSRAECSSFSRKSKKYLHRAIVYAIYSCIKYTTKGKRTMKLQETLEHLNFSRLEAQIYMALIGSEPMSAYQLAKKIAIARPSIYNALEHMLDKGMVRQHCMPPRSRRCFWGGCRRKCPRTFLSPGNSWKNMRRRSSRRCISYSGALKRRWQGQGSFWRMPGRRYI